MTSDVQTALKLLAVGMITVFVVLLLVVLTSRLIIQLVNHFTEITPSEPSGNQRTTRQESDLPPSTVAAIIAAVEITTEGKGIVEKIERKNIE